MDRIRGITCKVRVRKMTTESSESSPEKDRKDGAVKDVVLLISAIAAIVAAMVASNYYPYPDGKPLGLVSFVALWFREILLLLVPAFAVVAICVVRIIKLAKGSGNAL